MNLKRIGCLVLAAFVALLVGVLGSFFIGEIPAKDPIPRAAAETALRREEALAARLGLAVTTRHAEASPVHASPPPFVVTVPAGECVAVVAAAWGHQQIRSVAVADAATGEVLSRDEPSQALAGQAQWCSDRTGAYKLVVELTRRDLYGRRVDGHVSVRELRAAASRAGGLAGLRRGEVTPAGARSLSAATFGDMAERLSPARGAPLAPDLLIPSEAALLVPEDTVTYRELHQHARNGTSDNVSPRTTRLPPTVPAGWRPLAPPGGSTPFDAIRARVTPSPATEAQFPFMEDEGHRRALAVIDGRRLGVPCVELTFVRMLYGRDVELRAHPRGGAHQEVAARQNVASRRLCGRLETYSVPATDQERWLLRIRGG